MTDEELENELGFKIIDTEGHYQILPGRILDYTPLKTTWLALLDTRARLQAAENERDALKEAKGATK